MHMVSSRAVYKTEQDHLITHTFSKASYCLRAKLLADYILVILFNYQGLLITRSVISIF